MCRLSASYKICSDYLASLVNFDYYYPRPCAQVYKQLSQIRAVPSLEVRKEFQLISQSRLGKCDLRISTQKYGAQCFGGA